MFQVYGIGQALIPVLPPPLPFENPPTVNQTNYEIGQVVFTPPKAPTAFYLYAGAGNWFEFVSGSGYIASVVGTANEVTLNTVAGVSTVSLPSLITTPGSLSTTTTLTAGTALSSGTSIIAGTTITSTLGNIAATNGNLVLGTAGNKLTIATGSNASLGTSGVLSSGTVTVATTAVTAASKIFLTRAVAGGTLGNLSVGTITANTSFTITSDSSSDTSTVNWLIIN
jgi:hypothetical protein